MNRLYDLGTVVNSKAWQLIDSWSKPAWTVHVNLVLQTAAIAWCDGSLQWLRASENKGPIKNATIIHYPNLTHQTCPNVRHPAALFHHWPLCTLLPSSQPQSVGGGGATFARHLTFLILIRSGVIRATGLTMFNDIGNSLHRRSKSCQFVIECSQWVMRIIAKHNGLCSDTT